MAGLLEDTPSPQTDSNLFGITDGVGDALGHLYSSVKRYLAPETPLWNPATSPVGTSRVGGDVSAGMPDPNVSPTMDTSWGGSRPPTVAEYKAMEKGTQTVGGTLMAAEMPDLGPGPSGSVAAASRRVRPPGSRPSPVRRGAAAAPEVLEYKPAADAAPPAATDVAPAPGGPGAGHNMPPSAIVPDLPPGGPGGLLFDPVLGAKAAGGAPPRTAAEYEDWITGRRGLLDEGIAGLNKPVGTRPGSMAALPNLRAMSIPDAIETAKPEPHIIPNREGGYVGAPFGIRSPADVQAMRDKFDTMVEKGAAGSDWYDRVQGFINEVAGRDPVKARQLSEEFKLFSAQSDPYTNLGFAQQARNAWVRDPENPATLVRTGQQAETFSSARAAQDEFLSRVMREAVATRDPADLFPNLPGGPKTDIYGQHMDPTSPVPTTGTNDIWHARMFGYTEPGPNGTRKPWDSALGEAQHTFLDYETMLAVDRANAKGLGGRSNWTASEIQAAPWVQGKAEGLMRKYPNITPEEAFQRALKTYPDFAGTFTANMPHEQVPAASSGLTTGSMTPEEWQAGGRRVSPGGIDQGLTGLGFNTRATTPAYGAWREGTGPLEINPVDVSRPMVFLPGGTAVHPGTMTALESAAGVRGLTDFQAGSPVTLWDKRAGSNARTSVTIDLGRGTTRDEAAALSNLADAHEMKFSNRGEGAGFMNFNEAAKGPDVQKLLDAGLADKIRAIVPEAEIGRADTSSGKYVDYEGRLAAANAGQGQATRYLDELLQRNLPAAPGVYRGLLEDPNEAVKAQQNLARLQASGQMGVRPDYERWLRLLSEGRLKGALDWARANAYQGLPAAAGGVGLGAGIAGADDSRRPGS